MPDRELHVVTGAFGYSGRYITERLLRAGHRVRTLTNSPDREHPFGPRVEVHPFNFDHPERLASSLEGAPVLYTTYWVRFNYDDFRYSQAVDNTRVLFAAERTVRHQATICASRARQVGRKRSRAVPPAISACPGPTVTCRIRCSVSSAKVRAERHASHFTHSKCAGGRYAAGQEATTCDDCVRKFRMMQATV